MLQPTTREMRRGNARAMHVRGATKCTMNSEIEAHVCWHARAQIRVKDVTFNTMVQHDCKGRIRSSKASRDQSQPNDETPKVYTATRPLHYMLHDGNASHGRPTAVPTLGIPRTCQIRDVRFGQIRTEREPPAANGIQRRSLSTRFKYKHFISRTFLRCLHIRAHSSADRARSIGVTCARALCCVTDCPSRCRAQQRKAASAALHSRKGVGTT